MPAAGRAHRVLQAARRHVWVESDAGVTRLRVRGGVDLVPGDRVIPDADGAVSRRLERRSVLARRTARETRVLAAGVDDLAIVTAAGPHRSGAGMIARCIAAALAEGITPVVVLNKADADAACVLPARAEGWRRLGFEALVVSARTGAGLEALAARFRGREVALVGASGVGKSTLINALHPEADAAHRRGRRPGPRAPRDHPGPGHPLARGPPGGPARGKDLRAGGSGGGRGCLPRPGGAGGAVPLRRLRPRGRARMRGDRGGGPGRARSRAPRRSTAPSAPTSPPGSRGPGPRPRAVAVAAGDPGGGGEGKLPAPP